MGALIAAGGGILYSLKEIPVTIYKKIKQHIIYSVKVYQYDDLFDMLEKWLSRNYVKQYRDVEASLYSDTDNQIGYSPRVEGVVRSISLCYKQEDNTFIIKWLGKRLLITKDKQKMEKAQSMKDVYFRKYSLSGVKARESIDDLLKEVIRFCREDEEQNTIRVYTNGSYGEWFSGSTVRVKPLGKTILNPTKKQFIIDDVTTFIQSEDWYVNISVPYKRGYCFYGPPGTGKTTLALGIANHLKRNVYCLNLNCLDNDSKLPILFANMPANAVLLLEDIDRVFAGRENVKEGSNITFSGLLNCMDGAFYKHGLTTIITTNHIDKLDEALLRTGRIDVKMEIARPSDKEISTYLSHFYEKDIKIEGNFDLTMSDIQEVCLTHRHCPEEAIEKIISLIKN